MMMQEINLYCFHYIGMSLILTSPTVDLPPLSLSLNVKQSLCFYLWVVEYYGHTASIAEAFSQNSSVES